MKKTLLFFLLLGASFFFGQTSWAYTNDTTYDWTTLGTDDGLSQCASGCDSATHGYPYQEYVPTVSGYAQHIYLYSNHYGSIMANDWDLIIKNNSGTEVGRYYFTMPYDAPDYPNVRTTTLFDFVPYSFTTPFHFESGVTYRLSYVCHNCEGVLYYPSDNWLGHTPSTTYSAGQTKTSDGTAQNMDAWVSVYLTDQASGTDIYFSSTPTSTCDFSYWPIVANVAEASSTEALDHWSVGVMSGLYGYPLVIQDSGLSWYAYTLLTDTTVRKKSPLPMAQAYEAYAYICNSQDARDCDMSLTSNVNNHLVAKSATWQFITPEDPTMCNTSTMALFPSFAWAWNTSTGASVTGTAPNVNCNFNCDGLGVTDGLVCGLKEGICNIGRLLFYPSQSALDSFANLKYDVERKPPFGYIAIYTGQFTTMTTTVATTTADFSFLGNITLVSRFRTTLAWIFYVVFAIWVIKRLSNFSLHG